MASGLKVVALLGPTASGKSSMALKLAKRFNGEIICADSRTIYKGMDIGTAKPSAHDQKSIRYHCLDLVTPDQNFSAAQFKMKANQVIKDINARGKIAFLVGGSGLYADSVLYDYGFAPKNNVRIVSEKLEDLQALAKRLGYTPPEQTSNNPRHLAGFIKRGGVSKREKLPQGYLVVGILVDKSELAERIDKRVDVMFEEGLVEETRQLLEKWGKNAPGFLTPGYKPVVQYLSGKIDLEEAKRLFKRNDKQLAKRQMTWFKRNKDIHWIATVQEAEQLIEEKII